MKALIILKRTAQFVFGLILLILLIFIVQYIFAPVYNFPEPVPFSGDKIFNPYQQTDSSYWRKANFQVQSAAWFGVTDGRYNTNEIIDSTFRYLDYDVICISDYMKINEYGKEAGSYIPVYEHGYNLWKRHQVCIGAHDITWRDYAFYQNLHHKQHIINELRDHSELIIIAHPNYEDGWEAEDFKWMTNYDGLEILNYFRQSIEHWDSALSAGYYVIGIGDDDVHDITNPNEVGQYCTLIYSESLLGDSIVQAMKDAKVIAAHIYRDYDESFEVKKSKLKDIAKLEYAQLKGDTFFVKVNRQAHVIDFIGQDGISKKHIQNADSAFYIIQPEDTYIRTQINFPNRNVFYLSPIVRYSGVWPPDKPLAQINQVKTWVYRILIIASLLFIFINILFLRRRFRKKS